MIPTDYPFPVHTIYKRPGDLERATQRILKMYQSETLKKYGDEIAKRYVRRDPAELSRLVLKAQDGDIVARDMVLDSTLPFVIWVANVWIQRNPHCDPSDIISEGNLGLFRAIESYDNKRASFTTYAAHWITKYIRNHVMRGGTGLSISTYIIGGRNILPKTTSLVYESGDHREIEDEPDIDFEVESSYSLLEEMLKLVDLTEIEHKTLIGVFGLYGSPVKTNRDIGKELGKTGAAISYAKERALTKLRKAMKKCGVESIEDLL